MTTLSPAVSAPAVRSGLRPWVRAGLLWAQILVITGALVFGVRTSTLGHLQGRLDDHRVDVVTVGGGMEAGEWGSAVQQVRWREGPIRYQVEVTQVVRFRERYASTSASGATSAGDIGDRLQRRHPGLTVHRGPFVSWGASYLGWEGPSWVALTGYLVYFLALGLLLSGGEHWRATRWAWFWLISNPLGVIAYLVLSGPMSPLPAPRDPARRLTGGWAFLIAVVVSSAIRGVS